MIHAVYHRKYHRLAVSGHANSGEKGHDLVCAAVSGLVLTAAANVESFVTQGNARSEVIQLNEGAAEISCIPVHKMKNVATLIMDTICTGFEVLQSLYPEYISFEAMD